MESQKVTCDDVNKLVAMCSIKQDRAITSFQQCSSSLFVLLYQRLYSCTIEGIESSPYTLQQKQGNVTLVLNELREKRGMDVTGIDAEQIIQFNEEHISRLIRLFLGIAQEMRRKKEMGDALSAPLGSKKSPSTRDAFVAASARPVLAELPNKSAENGTWYAPVRTVEEGKQVLHIDNVLAAPFPQKHVKAAFLHLDEERLGQPQGSFASPHQTHHVHPRHIREMDDGVGAGNAAVIIRGEVEEDDDDVAGALVMGPAVKEEHEYGGSTGSYGNGDEEEEIPTKRLVDAWSAEVIPPRRFSKVIKSSCIADIRERLQLMDERLKNEDRQRERRQQAAVQRHVGVSEPEAKDTRHIKRHERPKVVLPRSLVPDAVSAEDLLRHEPKRMIDYTLRNEKIEMLRSIRFIDDLQKEIRRTMVQRHNDATRQLRDEVREALDDDRRERLERMRQVKDEDQRYRSAYKAIMAAACNDLRTAKDLMMERTRQLAEYHSHSLRESRRMCQYMKRESKERMRHDLLRYASTVTGWQSHFVS
ncbi:hypothetical protein TraAM80_02707 [Trypanosoma rangeli]|uniref:Uncharacterized protein n=1 Tax=Trypanosoma rangeli TaxID=5698 RepID=A0A3R7M3R3_TRYRA|nr:uncharacterized protein TraAM80_02707 [Trypanosoma rangeli]RNF08482.1 hypothetical protein TraAM80_02707 [Trypanosoma rangeli]|eukprot:RNF08482.1 hypothetical protein TraAM80_02707 [Trypanosoma rangeli]